LITDKIYGDFSDEGDRRSPEEFGMGLKASFTTNFEGGRATGEVWSVGRSVSSESTLRLE